jgi:cyclomaltodextrinase / maltogenic alpha-amylase / neopullulanase
MIGGRWLNAAHSRNIRIILDGVFNHCGRGFFAFDDVLENGEHSPYRDWFHILHFPVDAYSPGDARDYIGWWRHKSLPKFNTNNAEVREYLLDVARYWIEQGADGWRLDVPNEIDDDSFWAEFRQVVWLLILKLICRGNLGCGAALGGRKPF